MDNKTKLLLGLDIGATKCAVVVGDKQGKIIDKARFPTQAKRGAEKIIAELIDNCDKLIGKYDGKDNFTSVGISIGGPLDAGNGIIYSPPNLPGWDGVPLKKIIHKKLNLPVNVEHDAATCGLAESLWGAGKNASRLAYLTCGSGFGAGLVVDKKIYYGAFGKSPEIGHIRYKEYGPKAYGKTGSYEAFCAGNSLPKLAAWQFPKRWKNNPPSAQQLGELAQNEDNNAKHILNLNARAVGSACALLGDLLAPQIIVLGSLAQYFDDKWIKTVREQFSYEVIDSVKENCAIKKSALGSSLQDYSTLAAALNTWMD